MSTPFGRGSLGLFDRHQYSRWSFPLVRQLPAATANGVALLEFPDFIARRRIDEPIKIAMHRLRHDRAKDIDAFVRQLDIDGLGLGRASPICEPGNLPVAPFRIVAGKDAEACFGTTAANEYIGAGDDVAPGLSVRHCLAAK